MNTEQAINFMDAVQNQLREIKYGNNTRADMDIFKMLDMDIKSK